MSWWSRKDGGADGGSQGDGHAEPPASITLPVTPTEPTKPAQPAEPAAGGPLDPDDDLVLEPLRRIVTPERYAELESAIKGYTLTLDGGSDDELADLGFLDLLTAEEEDVVVASMVTDTVGELRDGPTPPALLEAMITLLENGFRCRVRAEATVITLISDTPLTVPVEGAEPATGGLISVGVAVDDSTRGTITAPYDTEAQRAVLSTPGNRIAVRVSIRDPRRITLDLEAFTATD